MKLTFLGTRGYIDVRTSRHHMHASLMVTYYGKDVMIDCGEDWLDRIHEMRPDAIFVTHAHPDHAWGLKNGALAPVYATQESWDMIMHDFAIEDRVVVQPRSPVSIGQMTLEAFPVVHSTRAPAVGYRITAGDVSIFYVPDVVYIEDRKGALSGVDVYIGDGATITRSMVRKPGDTLIGHTPIRTELTWCEKESVRRAIFTHLGTEIVGGDERALDAEIRQLAEERGVSAEIAYDGMEVTLR